MCAVPRLDEMPVGMLPARVMFTTVRRVRTCVSVFSRNASARPLEVGCLHGWHIFQGVLSAIKKQSKQNWHGPGESDCLIKTKHCDGRRAVLTQCDFCPVL